MKLATPYSSLPTTRARRGIAARAIRSFFGSTALVSLVVLALITIFLFREGLPFFAGSQAEITLYRRAGLEYVDILRRAETQHATLTRELSDIRQQTLQHLTDTEHLAIPDANARLSAFDDFADRVSDAITPVRGMISDLSDTVTDIKTRAQVENDKVIQRTQLLDAGKPAEAAQVKITPLDFAVEIKPVLATLPASRDALRKTADALRAILAEPLFFGVRDFSPAFDSGIYPAARTGKGGPINWPVKSGTEVPHSKAVSPLRSATALQNTTLAARMTAFQAHTLNYINTTLPAIERDLAAWDPKQPVPFYASAAVFFFGRDWITGSFWQDWYGILPLFTGSLLVSLIALVIAVPLGVGAAIYISQIATPREQRLVKPAIEFIAALPSVVLGFFGIAVLGELLRSTSQSPWLDWLPGFPIIERLNALTAGCLLALISIPTIFTLAEDALTNVPQSLRHASLAIGATHLQTTLRIITPAALSGIISAVLLGFGRVIGETMVVLLCAGNRATIPDFSAGPAVVTQPVHTMTGIIAQEMGEVVRGSVHYRALFAVGMVLFLLALLINYAAQKILQRHQLPTT